MNGVTRVDSQAVDSGALKGFGMAGSCFGNAASLTRAGKHELINTRQGCELMRQIRGQRNAAGASTISAMVSLRH